MKGTIATVTIEDARKEFVVPSQLRRQLYYLEPQDIVKQQELIGLLYDLVNSQVSVEIAWRHREYPKGKPEMEGKQYYKFIEAYEQFLDDKRLYFQFIKEYCESKRR
jgi:hypothetical protein